MRSFGHCVAALLLAGAWAVPATAQIVIVTPGQYLTGQVLGSLGNLALAIGQLAQHNRKLGEEISTARHEFWSSKAGAGRTAPAEQFERALILKDLHYLQAKAGADSAAWKKLFGGVLEAQLQRSSEQFAGTYEVDGGIPRYCRYEFFQWANSVLAAVGGDTTMEAALRQNTGLYKAYTEKRNIAEFLFNNPAGTLRAESPDPSTYLAAWLLGTRYARTVEAANAETTRITKAVSPGRLTEIVAVLRDWSLITDTVTGPWGTSSKIVMDALVDGKITAADADWSSHTLDLSQVRLRVAPPPFNQGAPIDQLRALWQQARVSHDWDTLHRAVATRDEVLRVAQMVATSTLTREEKVTASIVETSSLFLDRALESAALDMMQRGMRNPSKAAPQATVVEASAQRGPRRGAPTAVSQPALPAAPVAGDRSVAVRSVDDSNENPFTHTIELSENPNAIYVTKAHLTQSLVLLAQEADGILPDTIARNDKAVWENKALTDQVKRMTIDGEAERRKYNAQKLTEDTGMLSQGLRRQIAEYQAYIRRDGDRPSSQRTRELVAALQPVADDLDRVLRRLAVLRANIDPAYKAEPAAAPPPPPPAAPSVSRGGHLDYSGPPVPQNGEVVFTGLPAGKLRLQYDTRLWTVRLSADPSGTQRIILRSLKSGMRDSARVDWALE